MIFSRAAIAIIEPKAFDSPGLRSLLQLIILRNRVHIVQYHWGIFAGLNELFYLYIDERKSVCHENMPENLLWPMRAHLRKFMYLGDMGNGPVLTDLFGRKPLPVLTLARVYCYRRMIRSISAANFTGLPAIVDLGVDNCGVESIEIGAFDQIVDTLTDLYLLNNPLTRLNLNSFRKFLNTWPLNVLRKRLDFHYEWFTAITCSMEFYRVRNATLISFGYSYESIVVMLCDNDIHKLDRNSKRHEQIVHPLRWHLQHDLVPVYTFRKFHFEYVTIEQTLKVLQSYSDDYHLLVWVIREHALLEADVASITWFRKRIRCQKRNRWVEYFKITEFDVDSELIAACVIHISMRKQSVPLHCITIRRDSYVVGDDFIFNWLLFAGALVAEIAVLAVIWKRISKNRTRLM